MNFDNLKKSWDEEKSENLEIPSAINQLRKSTHPLEIIRQNMKKEFYTQIAAILFLALAPQLTGIKPSLYLIYYTSYAVLVIISAYYLYGFFKFYNQMDLHSLNTKDSLWKIYYEVRLNMERYQSFGFLLLPFLMVWMGVYGYSIFIEKGMALNDISTKLQIIIIVLVLITTAITISAIVLWTRKIYGKYADELKEILTEMNENH
jgi:hypothetical protein